MLYTKIGDVSRSHAVSSRMTRSVFADARTAPTMQNTVARRWIAHARALISIHRNATAFADSQQVNIIQCGRDNATRVSSVKHFFLVIGAAQHVVMVGLATKRTHTSNTSVKIHRPRKRNQSLKSLLSTILPKDY